MSALLWPGDQRAGDVFSDVAVLDALVRVETVWLAQLAAVGNFAAVDLAALVTPADVSAIAAAAESSGNPVVPLVALLRERVATLDDRAAAWLHRGLTSQDVLDTALMLCAQHAENRVGVDLANAVTRLGILAERHRATPMVARTLTQPALPYTFGLKAATWLLGLVDALDEFKARPRPAQFGGAAGTLAAVSELVDDSTGFTFHAANALGLAAGPPWHTTRAPVTRLANAWVAVTTACGRIANDVLLLARPEIGELAEPAGRGGSSTLPQKSNPVLSVLIKRAALVAPGLAAQVQTGAAATVDERADGGWHAEWTALQQLARHAVVAAAQTVELVEGLQVFPDRMAANLAAAEPDVRAEQRAIAELTGRPASGDYLGARNELIDAALRRAHRVSPQ